MLSLLLPRHICSVSSLLLSFGLKHFPVACLQQGASARLRWHIMAGPRKSHGPAFAFRSSSSTAASIIRKSPFANCRLHVWGSILSVHVTSSVPSAVASSLHPCSIQLILADLSPAASYSRFFSILEVSLFHSRAKCGLHSAGLQYYWVRWSTHCGGPSPCVQLPTACQYSHWEHVLPQLGVHCWSCRMRFAIPTQAAQ